MNQYTFTVTVQEGCDEWWEELDVMPLSQRLVEVKAMVSDALTMAYIEHEIKNETYYQLELDI